MNDFTILVVEDDAHVRSLIKTSLKLHDYNFEEAPNGKTAIATASSKAIDLVLLDLGLPDIDGI